MNFLTILTVLFFSLSAFAQEQRVPTETHIYLEHIIDYPEVIRYTTLSNDKVVREYLLEEDSSEADEIRSSLAKGQVLLSTYKIDKRIQKIARISNSTSIQVIYFFRKGLAYNPGDGTPNSHSREYNGDNRYAATVYFNGGDVCGQSIQIAHLMTGDFRSWGDSMLGFQATENLDKVISDITLKVRECEERSSLVESIDSKETINE